MRKKVIEIEEKEKLSFSKTAKRFGIGLNSVVRWSKRIESSYPKQRTKHKINRALLIKDIEEYPDAYHYERAERLGCSDRGVGKAIRSLGITFKKKSCTSEGKFRREAIISGQDR